MKVYIASDIRHAQKWINMRSIVYPSVVIVSTWIDFLKDGEPAQVSEEIIKQSWDNNLMDLFLCDVLVLYVERGDSMRGSCFEAGVAFSAGKRIIYVGEQEVIGTLGYCFELVDSLEHAFQLLIDEEMMKVAGTETRQ